MVEVEVQSRMEALIFERSLCEVHCPETSEWELRDIGRRAPGPLETSPPLEAWMIGGEL